jgi:hypothetical protein
MPAICKSAASMYYYCMSHGFETDEDAPNEQTSYIAEDSPFQPLQETTKRSILGGLSALRWGRTYERFAESHTDNVPERGKALLTAGRLYLEYFPRATIRVLSQASEDLETYAKSGTWDAYECLARLYGVFGSAYESIGQIAKADEARVKTVGIIREMERAFYVQIIPNDDSPHKP